MPDIDAWEELGIEPCADRAAIRAAYLARLVVVHPDHSPSPEANDDTVRLTAAYHRALAEAEAGPPVERRAAPAPVSTAVTTAVAVAVVADDTIGLAAPADEVFLVLLEVADAIGEVVFVDRSVGMVQIIVELVDEPICQILLTMQGRASGITEVFVTIESLDAAPPPPIDAVVRLLVDTMTRSGSD